MPEKKADSRGTRWARK